MIKLLLTLSHDHGRRYSLRWTEVFSKQNLVSTNMAEDTAIAHGRVYDVIQSLDTPMEQCIASEMFQHCRFAHSRYVNHRGQ